MANLPNPVRDRFDYGNRVEALEYTGAGYGERPWKKKQFDSSGVTFQMTGKSDGDVMEKDVQDLMESGFDIETLKSRTTALQEGSRLWVYDRSYRNPVGVEVLVFKRHASLRSTAALDLFNLNVIKQAVTAIAPAILSAGDAKLAMIWGVVKAWLKQQEDLLKKSREDKSPMQEFDYGGHPSEFPYAG